MARSAFPRPRPRPNRAAPRSRPASRHPGSLGIAISEAVEVAAKNPDVKYALGSVLNHVMLHQTIIGQEAMKQFEMAGDDPDVIIACAGGGSNFAGLVFPFLGLQLRGGRKRRMIAVEPAACPSLTRGKYAYDYGDTAHLTPLVKMYTLGSTFIPPGFHAGGLRYHGMGPLVSHVYALGLIEARAYQQLACFEAGLQFARCEGIIPAPESTHAVRCAIDEALRCKQEGKAETFCSTSRATAISTWAPTSATSPASLDQNMTRANSPWRSPACRRWRRNRGKQTPLTCNPSPAGPSFRPANAREAGP